MNLLRYIRHIGLQLWGLFVFGRRVGILGPFTVVNPRNVRIGSDCGINHNVFILGHSKVVIGNGVVLSAGAMLIDSGLHLDGFAKADLPAHFDSYVIIEDGAWIGAGAIILPGVTVGTKSVVGAGSVVTRDVPPYSVVTGNPARPIGRTDG